MKSNNIRNDVFKGYVFKVITEYKQICLHICMYLFVELIEDLFFELEKLNLHNVIFQKSFLN